VQHSAITRRRLSIASEAGDRRWHRVLVIGLVTAVVVHAAVFLLVRDFRVPPLPEADGTAAGPPMGDVRAAQGGGSGLTMVQVRPESEQEEAVPEPTPEPVPEEVEVEPEEPDTPVEDPVNAEPSLPGRTAPGQGGVEGDDTGTGRENGTGEGAGGTDAQGDSGIQAPVPRGLILPPADRPASVRGRELTVWVFVNPRGRVVADSTRLDPPTPDRGYNDRLRRSAAEWVFTPGTQQGRPVGAWYPYQIIL
jgi:hypothetical protein